MTLAVFIGLGLGVFIFCCGALALGAFYLVTEREALSLPAPAGKAATPTAEAQPASPEAAAGAEPTLAAPQLLPLPTTACAGPAFTLDGKSFRLEAAAPAAGSPLPLPAAADTALYVQEAGGRRLVLLAAGALAQGEAAQAEMIDETCNVQRYQLLPPLPGRLDDVAQFAPAADLVIFAAQGADGNGWLIQGMLTEAELTAPRGWTPQPGELLAEIGLLEAQPSPDGRLIQVRLSLYNFGAEPLLLTPADVQLSAEGLGAAPPAAARPPLPLEVAPGQTAEVELAFVRPPQGWGILRVFSVEYDLADFVE